jgi:cell shape-determining protein MreD
VIGGVRFRLAAVLLLLVTLHFLLRPFLGDARIAPDLLLLALMIYAIQARPVVGLVADALTPVAFGAGALAHTCVGYLAAWGKAVFFAESIPVSAGFFLAGTWLRDLVVLLAGRHLGERMLLWQLAVWSPLKALTTAVAGVIVLALFRRWLGVRSSG